MLNDDDCSGEDDDDNSVRDNYDDGVTDDGIQWGYW